MNKDFGLIAADTSRTRAYLHSLKENNLLPVWVVVLDNVSQTLLPGQQSINGKKPIYDYDWPEALLNPEEKLDILLTNLGVDFIKAGSANINDPSVIELIRCSNLSLFIYSGYGGAIVGNALLKTKKSLLHIHGGYLPTYKGSTTNYFSFLNEGMVGASAIFLTSKIDSGPILLRQKYKAPHFMQDFDHIYDAAIRARLLVEVLNLIIEDQIEFEENKLIDGDTFYVIHPVLKHIAIMRKI